MKGKFKVTFISGISFYYSSLNEIDIIDSDYVRSVLECTDSNYNTFYLTEKCKKFCLDNNIEL